MKSEFDLAEKGIFSWACFLKNWSVDENFETSWKTRKQEIVFMHFCLLFSSFQVSITKFNFFNVKRAKRLYLYYNADIELDIERAQIFEFLIKILVVYLLWIKRLNLRRYRFIFQLWNGWFRDDRFHRSKNKKRSLKFELKSFNKINDQLIKHCEAQKGYGNLINLIKLTSFSLKRTFKNDKMINW